MSRCKNILIGRGFVLTSNVHSNESANCHVHKYGTYINHDIRANTEYGAVFLAVHWCEELIKKKQMRLSASYIFLYMQLHYIHKLHIKGDVMSSKTKVYATMLAVFVMGFQFIEAIIRITA